MGISHYIKDIGRGARGARAVTRAQAQDLLGQVLDGQVTDLEIGAFCIAMRIKGETAEEMGGFLDALHARSRKFAAGSRPTIVLPSYNGARRLPVLTPLLALLLAREGLPVLLHGMRTEARRILASDVLEAVGIAATHAPEDPSADLPAIAPGTVAHIATEELQPGLARLLAVRDVIGLRNPGHSAAKLYTPCAGPCVLVTSYTHPEYATMLQECLQGQGATALLSRGLEGEVVADPRRMPRYDGFVQGAHRLLQEQQPGTATEVPGLPEAIDVDTTADYTRRVLAGELPVPEAIAQQVAYILQIVQALEAAPAPAQSAPGA
ncbi:DNA-binding protein YbiB [Comamonas endophytica]|uniref:DNA-binding protein YbiB n=1 Tax=Comamonas endophytica TaxID=2949090 RepID=A0ABY6G7Y9_9BURK|nr:MULTISPECIES: DNA-binding protein YbiB [unclassified Acidovorax]MCD2511651.1 DNA-binding protein YbiB [Acidovorax sp. D4N7]UYG51033.1 DNA-binding protein YbiB [Acidovorax sp. 5MLIR]